MRRTHAPRPMMNVIGYVPRSFGCKSARACDDRDHQWQHAIHKNLMKHHFRNRLKHAFVVKFHSAPHSISPLGIISIIAAIAIIHHQLNLILIKHQLQIGRYEQVNPFMCVCEWQCVSLDRGPYLMRYAASVNAHSRVCLSVSWMRLDWMWHVIWYKRMRRVSD